MTEKLQNILVKNWEQMTLTEKKNICGEHFDAETQICDDIPSYCPTNYGGMRKELYKIFYNVFIIKKKFKTSDPLIIENASIQAHGKPLSINLNRRKIDYDMGGHPYKTLKTILPQLFEQKQYIEFNDMLGKNFFANLKQQPVPEFVILYSRDSLDESNKQPLKQIQLRKDKESFNYVLRAAVLIYEDENNESGHAVAGLFCDDEYYIFDSNNILLRMDWTSPDHSKYIKKVNKMHDCEYFYVMADYAIYVKED
jgi:hypothetical protein